jgi:putative phosphoesterase
MAERPDAVLHMGDSEGAFEKLTARLGTALPECRTYGVRGNCDSEDSAPGTLVVTLAGKRFFMLHGHQYAEIKRDYDYYRAVEQAKRNRADVLLCGHTHSQMNRRIDDMLVVNPGAAMLDRYAVAEIGDDGAISVRFAG